MYAVTFLASNVLSSLLLGELSCCTKAGPPGSGKTLLARACAAEAGWEGCAKYQVRFCGMYAEIRMPVISNHYGLLEAGVAFLNVAATEFVASWLSCIFLFSRMAVTSFGHNVLLHLCQGALCWPWCCPCSTGTRDGGGQCFLVFIFNPFLRVLTGTSAIFMGAIK